MVRLEKNGFHDLRRTAVRDVVSGMILVVFGFVLFANALPFLATFFERQDIGWYGE
jgi:hypothetical protein